MTRLLPGLVMTVLWVMILVAGPTSLFWLLIVCMTVFGLLEYFKMTLNSPVSGSRLLVPVGIAALPVFVSIMNDPDLFIVSLFLSLFGSIIFCLKAYARLGNPLHFLSLSSFGTLYIGFCLAHLVFIRHLPQGVAWLLVLTAVTAGSDTGAYYLGRTFGRRKLCPNLSPGKTVVGAVGGVVTGTLAAVLVGGALLPEFNPEFIAVTAFSLSLVSIIGDLVESVVKRAAGVKDSGKVLFGHGGVLDRIDSMLIAAPLLYYLVNVEVLL
ncbi:MAG: phosphatidate cytidylyltransferase [Desulfobulbaceae bacterium]|nr:phosphatidate cytidylyltransferase [Desulfobulbaceae bacterium]